MLKIVLTLHMQITHDQQQYVIETLSVIGQLHWTLKKTLSNNL